MLSVYIYNEFLFDIPSTKVKDEIKQRLGINDGNYYLLMNGKLFSELNIIEKCPIHIVPRLIGGKGGFGSMLRAIGAQIEKTTNREACRDLSGRRLRDINEEKRLKTWIAQQVEREKEAEDRKKKKLERLCKIPKHEFQDENYEKERSSLPDKVGDALEQGLKAGTSGISHTSTKRKNTEIDKNKKKRRLWVGSDDDLSCSDDSENDNDSEKSEELKLSEENVLTEQEKSNKEPEIGIGEDEREKEKIHESVDNKDLQDK